MDPVVRQSHSATIAPTGAGRITRRGELVNSGGTRGQLGLELADWFQFQPIFDRISRDSPDTSTEAHVPARV